MLVCILRVLLGLARVLLALGVVILAVRLGSGTMGLRRGFVMLRRLVVGVFHFDLLLLADKFRLSAQATSIVAAQSANGVYIKLSGHGCFCECGTQLALNRKLPAYCGAQGADVASPNWYDVLLRFGDHSVQHTEAISPPSESIQFYSLECA
jgi:hypothetical protein